jgi:hypothetical protein
MLRVGQFVHPWVVWVLFQIHRYGRWCKPELIWAKFDVIFVLLDRTKNLRKRLVCKQPTCELLRSPPTGLCVRRRAPRRILRSRPDARPSCLRTFQASASGRGARDSRSCYGGSRAGLPPGSRSGVAAQGCWWVGARILREPGSLFLSGRGAEHGQEKQRDLRRDGPAQAPFGEPENWGGSVVFKLSIPCCAQQSRHADHVCERRIQRA